MRIIVCGGRDYGHVVRTTANPEDEPDGVLERCAEYGYIHTVLHHAIMAYSKERNDHDNWLPTDITIIEGGATGADSAAHDFAVIHYTRHEQYPADWKNRGRGAGPIRNQQMIDTKPDLIIAFPGGRGTADMIYRAILANLPVIECDGKTIPTFKSITEN